MGRGTCTLIVPRSPLATSLRGAWRVDRGMWPGFI